MSEYMLNDQAAINDINPFVEFDFSLPGAWSKPPDYATGKFAMDKETDSDPPSPACDLGITAGDRTVDWCRRPPENCPLDRMWEPQRAYDPEFYYKDIPRPTNPTPTVGIEKDLLVILVLLLIFYVMLDITRK
jgi:hypothetical protein